MLSSGAMVVSAGVVFSVTFVRGKSGSYISFPDSTAFRIIPEPS